MERFHLSVLNDHLTVDPATFLDRPELIRRLLDTTDGILELTQNKKLLLPLLFDFLETIVQARRSETVGTPLQTAREIVKLICESSQPVFAIRTLDPSCGSGAFPLALLEQAAEKNTLFVDKIEGLERDEHLRNCVMLMARFYDPFESRVTVADGGSPYRSRNDHMTSSWPTRLSAPSPSVTGKSWATTLNCLYPLKTPIALFFNARCWVCAPAA